MKIGVTCYPTYGGSGVVATELGKAMAQRQHQIHFISYSLPFRLQHYDARIFFHEVEMVSYPLLEHSTYAIALAAKMSEVGGQVGLDLFHVHYAIPHAVSAFLARSILGPKGPRIVTTLHGTDITLVGSDHSYLPITRFAIEQSDGVTAISHHLRETTCREFDVRRDIRVIYNFVNCDIYQPERDEELYAEFAPHGEPLLAHLSNFRPVKRVPDVVEIFARVRRQMPARLLLIGDGPERGNAEYQVHRLGLESDVLFLGKQDDVYRLLPLCDVLLLPSLTESFGLAALEAMACGAVPIASRVGGLPEVVVDGQDGFLCEVGDVETMAERALRLLRDRELRAQMGLAARRTAQERFCSTLIIPEYERFYREVLGN
jgi:N-acetyl-alpha-D-glucosaminyl L-malate synthase BshA